MEIERVDMNEFEKDKEIDKFALDDEWRIQPSIYYKWSKILAKAREDSSHAETNYIVVKAKIEKDIRMNPKKYNVIKGTESEVSGIRQIMEEYKVARDLKTLAEYNVNVLEGAVKAMEHKKQGLENMVKLFLNNYYADPKIPTEAREISEDITRKKIQEKTAEGMKRRKL